MVTKCDRCGNDITEDQDKFFKDFDKTFFGKTYDLCKKCQKELQKITKDFIEKK